jgi:hypothetical protein
MIISSDGQGFVSARPCRSRRRSIDSLFDKDLAVLLEELRKCVGGEEPT